MRTGLEAKLPGNSRISALPTAGIINHPPPPLHLLTVFSGGFTSTKKSKRNDFCPLTIYQPYQRPGSGRPRQGCPIVNRDAIAALPEAGWLDQIALLISAPDAACGHDSSESKPHHFYLEKGTVTSAFQRAHHKPPQWLCLDGGNRRVSCFP